MKVLYCLLAIFVVVSAIFVVNNYVNKKNSFISSGKIVYVYTADGVLKMYSLDLTSKKVTQLYEINGCYSGSISKIDSEWIVLGIEAFGSPQVATEIVKTVHDSAHNKPVNLGVFSGAGIEEYLYKFNIKTKELISLGYGYCPIYIPAYKKILFLSSSRGKPYFTHGMYIMDTDGGNLQFITKCPAQYNNIVAVSDKEVVFLSETEERLLYNLETKRLSILLSEDHYMFEFWRSKTNQLVYRLDNADKYFFTNLDSSNIIKAPKNTENSQLSKTVLYILEKDIAILSVEKMWWYYIGYHIEDQLWAYDFATGEKKLITSHCSFREGGGAYFSE